MRKRFKELEKDIDRIIIKAKIKMFLKKAFILLCFVVFLAGYLALAQLVKEQEFLYNILIYIFVLMVTYSLFFYFSLLSKGCGSSYKKNLQEWMNNIRCNDYLIRNISSNKPKGCTIDNLNLLKEEIVIYCKNDIMNFRLLRSYFYTLKTNNEQIKWQTVIGLIVLIMGYLIQASVVDDFSLTFYGAEFTPFQILFGFIIVIFTVYNDLNSSRDRVLLLYKITD